MERPKHIGQKQRDKDIVIEKRRRGRKKERERNSVFQLPTWCVIFDPFGYLFSSREG